LKKEDARQAGEVGAAAPPTDVDTTGNSLEIDAQAATTAEDWTQNPYVQIEGGFLAGISLGLVPMGGVGQQLADAGELLPNCISSGVIDDVRAKIKCSDHTRAK
jgi:hypothetical protein